MLGLGVLLIPVVIKKELQELKIISFLLFVTVFGFIGLTIYQISSDGVTIYNSDFDDKNQAEFFYHDYYVPKLDVDLITGINFMLVSYSCQ